MYLKGDTMKNIPLLISTFVAIYAIGFNSAAGVAQGTVRNGNQENIKLGVFSVSLSVKDLEASKAFYEKLGFLVFGGGMEKNYLIMKNGNALIGLFQGMFEGNILTFNPGWDEEAKNMDDFDDIREIQRHLKENGISLTSEADENTSGPANLMLTDPDGNVILLDQHR
jgi:catechol 2,3-dioxygenase-like lactoylglutathione lyase family enzyme